MTAETVQAARARLIQSRDRARETAKRGDIFDPNPQLAAMAIEATRYSDAIDTLLADHARLEGEVERLRSAESHSYAMMFEADRDRWKIRAEAAEAELAESCREVSELREGLKQARDEVAAIDYDFSFEKIDTQAQIRLAKRLQGVGASMSALLQRGEQPDRARIAEIAKSEACMGDDGQRPCKEKVSAPATGDNAIKAAIVELDERTYRRTMMQTNAMATIGDGSRQSYRAFVAETDRLFALMEGLKRCLPSKRPALSSHEQGEG